MQEPGGQEGGQGPPIYYPRDFINMHAAQITAIVVYIMFAPPPPPPPPKITALYGQCFLSRCCLVVRPFACLNTGKSVFVYQKVIMGTLLIVLIVNMKATLSNDPETRSVKFEHMPTQRKLSSVAFFHGDRQVCVPKVGSPCHHCHV